MKAQFIRGEDPKKSMRVGLVQKWLSLKKGDILKIIKEFTTDSQHEIRKDSRYHIFPKGDYLQISNTESELFDDGCIGFTAYLGDKSTRSVDDIFIWGTPLQLEENLILVPRIQEAQHFTRGTEPKKSMDIGQSHLDKKFIEKTEWWVKYDPTLYEIIDFIKDYRGYFILLMSSKCTENIQVEKENYFRGETYYIGTSTLTTELGGKVAKTPEKALLKIKNDIDEYIEQLPEIKDSGFNESVNFERGVDPKDSMRIGRIGERAIKKVLDLLVKIRGGEYKIKYLKDCTEGTYLMPPGYDHIFRADNFFIRYYFDSSNSEYHFTYGYRIEGKIMKEKILATAEEGLTEILNHITPLPHG